MSVPLDVLENWLEAHPELGEEREHVREHARAVAGKRTGISQSAAWTLLGGNAEAFFTELRGLLAKARDI